MFGIFRDGVNKDGSNAGDLGRGNCPHNRISQETLSNPFSMP